MACGAADDFVTDFGPVLSLFFVDPDGLDGEVLVANPGARPGVFNPPGTPASLHVVTVADPLERILCRRGVGAAGHGASDYVDKKSVRSDNAPTTDLGISGHMLNEHRPMGG